MKVAILVPKFVKFSGDARVAERQARDLLAQGQQVAVFALDADIKVEGLDLFILGLPKSLLWTRLYRLLFPLDLRKTLSWLPRLKEFDLIIAHLYPMTWLAFWARKLYGVKYTFWNHGTGISRLFPSFPERVYTGIYQFLTRITTSNADRIVSVSQYLRKEFRRQTGRDSEVVYNTVDHQRFHPGLDGNKMREKYGLGQSPVILSVGRVSPPKGFHLLIQAFRLVQEKIPEAKLVIVGHLNDDTYGRKLRGLADSSVVLTGSVSDEDLPYYYAMCDIYATCTLWEGYDLPLAEAQACGRPVVAFNLGPHPEVIDEKGVLVEPGNIELFAQACMDKIQQERGG